MEDGFVPVFSLIDRVQDVPRFALGLVILNRRQNPTVIAHIEEVQLPQGLPPCQSRIQADIHPVVPLQVLSHDSRRQDYTGSRFAGQNAHRSRFWIQLAEFLAQM